MEVRGREKFKGGLVAGAVSAMEGRVWVDRWRRKRKGKGKEKTRERKKMGCRIRRLEERGLGRKKKKEGGGGGGGRRRKMG